MMQQAGTKCMPEKVRRQFFGQAAPFPESLEHFGHVVAAQTPWLGACGGKHRWARIVAEAQITFDPGLAYGREEYRPRPVALADNFGLAGFGIDAVAIQRERFGDSQSRGEQHFDERTKAQPGKSMGRNNSDQLSHLLFRQEFYSL